MSSDIVFSFTEIDVSFFFQVCSCSVFKDLAQRFPAPCLVILPNPTPPVNIFFYFFYLFLVLFVPLTFVIGFIVGLSINYAFLYLSYAQIFRKKSDLFFLNRPLFLKSFPIFLTLQLFEYGFYVFPLVKMVY